MSFITKKIPSQVIAIADIGSYKIRVGICEFHGQELTLIGYGEKKQNIGDMSGQDIHSLPGVANTFCEAIKKAEKNAHTQIQNIVMNIPFDELFSAYETVEYTRKDNTFPIDQNELQNIIDYIEFHALKQQYRYIDRQYGYSSSQIDLVLSSVQKLSIDGNTSRKILGKTGAHIQSSLLNMCIPKDKYQMIQTLESAINKKITQVIPSEFALLKLSKQQRNIVIIDVGSCSTSIIVKKDGAHIGIQKLPLGIGSLIQNIQKKYPKTHTDIITSLDGDLYTNEKKDFIEVFLDSLGITLKEILQNQNCPNKFFITGGGANRFLTRCVEYMNLHLYDIKHIGSIQLLHTKDLSPKDEAEASISRSNLNIYAMMKAASEFITRIPDPIEKSLKKTVEKIHE
ncbi:hypothetical protein MK079_00080 [Candidatus Gracilibacteria bacterium]|nr:hypothetical protein [Candidatus Gracilibacteria bacterium]